MCLSRKFATMSGFKGVLNVLSVVIVEQTIIIHSMEKHGGWLTTLYWGGMGTNTGSASHWVVDNSSVGTNTGSASHWVVNNSSVGTNTGSASHWVVNNSSVGTNIGSASHWVEERVEVDNRSMGHILGQHHRTGLK